LAAIFDNVQVEHEGVYTCVASNWAGKDESDIDLIVLGEYLIVEIGFYLFLNLSCTSSCSSAA
jgi:hypothetical protein